jgi:hypothetical protein
VTDVERTHFFAGQLLTAADLEREQTYLREKRFLHNRRLHGFGVVDGLAVVPAPDGAYAVVVEPGLALDGCGREIVVAEPCRVSLVGLGPGGGTVVLTFAEYETERRTIRETYQLEVRPSSSSAGDDVVLAAVRASSDALPLVDLAPRTVVSSTGFLEAGIRSLEERVAALEQPD